VSTLSLSALGFAQQALLGGVRGGQPARFQGPEVTAYLTDVGIAYPAAWCAAFVYSMFEQAVAADSTGIAINPCPRTAGALRMYELAPLRSRRPLPAPGDLFVIVHTDGIHGHTGFVESVTPDGQTITSIEGDSNPAGSTTGDQMARHTWVPADGKRGRLRGFLEF